MDDPRFKGPGVGQKHDVEPRLDVITLAVADLEQAPAFYRDLGLESNGVIGTEWKDERTGANGAIAMFELDGGLLLNLYPRVDLAKDAAIPVGPAQSGEFSLAPLVPGRDEVDGLLASAAAAGATVTPARDRPWGIYSGYSAILTAIFGKSSGTRPGVRNRPPEGCRNTGRGVLHQRTSTAPYQARQPRRVLATNMCALLVEAIGPSGNCRKTTHELKATALPQRRIAARR